MEQCKDEVLPSKFGNIFGVRAQISNAVASLTHQMLENTWREVYSCGHSMRRKWGSHLEVLNLISCSFMGGGEGNSMV
jgi:hypothetical protein